MTKYFGRDGRPCQKFEWQRLRSDKSYATIKEYDNGQVYVKLEWVGEITDPSVFRDCWKMFRIIVANYDADGSARPDPVENLKTFAYEKDGIAAYENFLERWTASHRSGDGELVEEGNYLTPPPPPNLDAPVSDVAKIKGLEDDDIGAW